MIAFRIFVNGKCVTTAGLPGHHVVSVILSSIHRDAAKWMRDEGFVERELCFDVGGLDSDRQEHVDWFGKAPRVGDRIEVEILDTIEVDRPIRRRGPRRSKPKGKAALESKNSTKEGKSARAKGELPRKKTNRRAAKKKRRS